VSIKNRKEIIIINFLPTAKVLRARNEYSKKIKNKNMNKTQEKKGERKRERERERDDLLSSKAKKLFQ
jgi:hypothetical protein